MAESVLGQRIKEIIGSIGREGINQLRQETVLFTYDALAEAKFLPSNPNRKERQALCRFIEVAYRLCLVENQALSFYSAVRKDESGKPQIDKRQIRDRLQKLFKDQTARQTLEEIFQKSPLSNDKAKLFSNLLSGVFSEHRQEANLLKASTEDPHFEGFTNSYSDNHFKLSADLTVSPEFIGADPHFNQVDNASLSRGAMGHDAHFNIQSVNSGRGAEIYEPEVAQSKPTEKNKETEQTAKSKPTPSEAPREKLFQDCRDPAKKPESGLPENMPEHLVKDLEIMLTDKPYTPVCVNLLLHAREQGSKYHIVLNGEIFEAPTKIGNKRMQDDMTISKIYAYLKVKDPLSLREEIKVLVPQLLQKYHHPLTVSSLDRAYILYVDMGKGKWSIIGFRPNGEHVAIGLQEHSSWFIHYSEAFKSALSFVGLEERAKPLVEILLPENTTPVLGSVLAADIAYAISPIQGFKGQKKALEKAILGWSKKDRKTLSQAHHTELSHLIKQLRKAG